MIRLLRTGDLAGVLKIEKESFGADAWPAALFRYYAGACPGLFFVAREGRVAAGYSIACVAKNTASIDSIAVSPRYRGRGIASKLLRRTICKLRRKGVESITLMVRRENVEAIRLYRSFGFERTATVQGYYGDGSVAWRMRLQMGHAPD